MLNRTAYTRVYSFKLSLHTQILYLIFPLPDGIPAFRSNAA